MLALLALAMFVVAACDPTQPHATGALARKDPPRVAARIGSTEILTSEVDERISSRLAQIEMSRYEARRDQVESMVEDMLLDAEAERRGMPVADLLRTEIESKVAEPTDEQARSFFSEIQARGQTGSFDDLAPRIREAIYGNALNEQRSKFLAGLRRGASVEIALDPPRIDLDLSDGFGRGPESAPITLVEFSDYQCPYCARSQSVLETIRTRYGDQVRHVFMDFPLDNIHPKARAAAVAARCAGAQGEFWEYHSRLFERQGEIAEEENLPRWAEELSLDGAAFASCITDGEANAAVDRSLEAGARSGRERNPRLLRQRDLRRRRPARPRLRQPDRGRACPPVGRMNRAGAQVCIPDRCGASVSVRHRQSE